MATCAAQTQEPRVDDTSRTDDWPKTVMIYMDDSDADSQSNGQAAAEQDDNSSQGASNSQDAHLESGGGIIVERDNPSNTDCLDADDNMQRGQQLSNKIIRSSGEPLSGGLTCGDHNDYVAYSPIDALEGSEDSEDGILWINHEYMNSMFCSDYTDPEGQTKKTKERIAREKAGRLARVKNILATSTRQDWEADGSRLWMRKGDTQLRIVDLTDDEGRVELDEEWATSAGAGSVALRVELSICDGSELLAKVPAVCVDSGRAFIPWPHEDEEGRLVVARWHYDLCRVISAGEYLGAYPVRSYLCAGLASS